MAWPSRPTTVTLPKSHVPQSGSKETVPSAEEVLLVPLGEDSSAFERIQVEGVVKVQQTTPPPKDDRLIKVEVREECGCGQVYV